VTPDRIDANPDENAEHGVLDESGNLDTASITILGGHVAQVSVDLPAVAHDDDIDDDVVEDEVPVDEAEIRFENIGSPFTLEGGAPAPALTYVPEPRIDPEPAADDEADVEHLPTGDIILEPHDDVDTTADEEHDSEVEVHEAEIVAVAVAVAVADADADADTDDADEPTVEDVEDPAPAGGEIFVAGFGDERIEPRVILSTDEFDPSAFEEDDERRGLPTDHGYASDDDEGSVEHEAPASHGGEEPAGQESVVDAPAIDVSAADEPRTGGPVADEPTLDEPFAAETSEGASAVDEPVGEPADEPVGEEHAIDEVVDDEPAASGPAESGVATTDHDLGADHGVAGEGSRNGTDPLVVESGATEPATRDEHDEDAHDDETYAPDVPETEAASSGDDHDGVAENDEAETALTHAPWTAQEDEAVTAPLAAASAADADAARAADEVPAANASPTPAGDRAKSEVPATPAPTTGTVPTIGATATTDATPATAAVPTTTGSVPRTRAERAATGVIGTVPLTRREVHQADEAARVGRAHALERVRTPGPDVTLTSKRSSALDDARESPDLLTADRLLDPRQVARPEPEGLWQQLVYSVSGRRINLGDGRRARQRKELDRRISAPLSGGARFVPVLSRKGGVGKTTVTSLLGMALADARDDRVIAVDANPDRGTLADRVGRPNGRTVRDLVRAHDEVDGYHDVSSIVARDATRLDVLASDSDPRVSEAFSDDDYRQVADVAAHYYSIVLTDTGTGIVHSVMEATLERADSLVVVAGLSVDEARLASETLTWLETNGYAERVRSAIVVLNSARPGTPLVRESELEAHFRSRVHTVIRMPYDPRIAAGSAISFRDLQPETRLAARELAAAVVEGLRAPVAAA